MATLICDLCGGKLVMGSGGVATCDCCGMEYSADRIREKLQEIKCAAPVDNTQLIDNYMRIAQNAYKSNNKAEAESYCNKIIEITPSHQQAWLLKGKAAGWQSTLNNIRFSETINCFANAIEYTEEDEKKVVIDECKQEIIELAEGLIRLRGEHFAKWPDKDEKAGFMHDLTAVLQALLQFSDTVGVLINRDEIMSSLATIINSSVTAAWNDVIRPTFTNDHDGYPNDYEFKRLLERADYCSELLDQAIDLSNTDSESSIPIYENLISIHSYLIDAKSYSYKTVKVGNSNWDGSTIYDNQYVESKSLTYEAKKFHIQLISKYRDKIDTIKKAVAAKIAAEKEKNKKDFWVRYSEEHRVISDTITRLNQKRNTLSFSNTGFNQIKLIDITVQELSDIQSKDRECGQELSIQERNTISEIDNLWDKLKDLEVADDYFDKNPLLKKEDTIRNELRKYETCLDRLLQLKVYSHLFVRIIIMVVHTAMAVFFCFNSLFFSAERIAPINSSILNYLVFFILLAIAALVCLKDPLKWLRMKIKFTKAIKETAAQLNEIDTIKKKMSETVPQVPTISAKQPTEESENEPNVCDCIYDIYSSFEEEALPFSILSFIIGFGDVMISTGTFKSRYSGLLEGIVGNIPYLSAYLAIIAWFFVALLVFFITDTLTKQYRKKH